MDTNLWNGMVEFAKDTFKEQWSHTKHLFDEQQREGNLLKINYIFVCVFFLFLWALNYYRKTSTKIVGVLYDRYDSADKLLKLKVDAEKKKKFLDSLAATLGSWRSACTWLVGDESVRVNVAETELLIPKNKKGNFKLLTVTIFFPANAAGADVESLLESVKKISSSPVSGGDAGLNGFRGPNILQAKVKVTETLLSDLELLQKEASKIDRKCTIQIESWGILNRDAKKQLLHDASVPSIVHAEYAAGILTIAGDNLKGAEFWIATRQRSLKLEVKSLEEISSDRRRRTTGILNLERSHEVVTLSLRLFAQEVKDVRVYATKDIGKEKSGKLEKQSLLIHSRAIPVKDALWVHAFRVWLPDFLFTTLLVYSAVWGFFFLLRLFRSPFSLSMEPDFNVLAIIVFYPLLLSMFFQPQRHGEAYKENVHGFVRGVMTLVIGAVDLIKREPYLACVRSPIVDSKGQPRSPTASLTSTQSPPSVPTRTTTTSLSSSSSVESFVQSILLKEAAKFSIFDAGWEPCVIEKVVDNRLGKTVFQQVLREGNDFDAVNNPFYVVQNRSETTAWQDEAQVHLASKYLIKALQKHLPSHSSLFGMDRPKVPARDIYVILDELTIEDNGGMEYDELSKAQRHLDLLIKYIKEEFKEVTLRLERMREEKKVSYDLLWAFLYPNQKVVYNCMLSNILLCGTVFERLSFKHDGPPSSSSDPSLKIVLDIWDYNGKDYRKVKIVREIASFDGERSFEEVAVRPIGMASAPQEVLEAEFLANGRRFNELAVKPAFLFMNYQGAIYLAQRKSKNDQQSALKKKADGRVMIDTAGFASNNPDFKMAGAQPPRTRLGRVAMPPSYEKSELPTMESVKPVEPSDETLIYSPALVYGFSFAMKEWGMFEIAGFSEVSFNDTAYNELVMNPEGKDLIYSLASQYVAHPEKEDMKCIDSISNKGDGCIILCYGPPGTGKTLTAESVAEQLHRPLWAISLSELGVTPEEVECSLSRVLDIASMWQAVLLLDEADIFLEKRSMKSDLKRNAMVAVFLRLLEYYRGMMFLTTNRVTTFDEAVRSRISMFVRYHPLGQPQRELVWSNLLCKAGIHEAPSADVVSNSFNGREIRNAIQTAQVWAKSKNEPLQMKHVSYVVKIFANSVKEVEEEPDTHQNP